VRLAQDALDRGLIAGRRLEREEAGRDPLEMALGLFDEERPELVF
jgi:hypothetical protein